ncbi:amidohydrolase family protein [Cryptosporangium phraense]|uniref:Amidohydrolase family protein n=1 Tax=Cryptosporangium phraense TaxID=2593070 RepID=A0A545AQT6_9ACTN|nr:amidohydrolase family protein [Cryptosporangium phraense]TQS43678.1 amidohydrolase family protein [Cryptosporangium phraense]
MDVDTLIRNTTIVTMDADRRIITDGSIALAGDRIVAVGKTADVRVEAKTTIDGRRFLVTPGLINGHVHLTEALLKGFMPEALPFDESLFTWVMPLYEAHTAEEQQVAARLSALSMLRTGTTTFLDAGTTVAIDEVIEAVEPTGLRGRFGRWLQDRQFGPDGSLDTTDAALRAMEEELDRYPGGDGQRLAAWPMLVGHNTNTDELWRAAKAMADAHGAGISAHLSPAQDDSDWYLAEFGRRPVEHLASLGVLGPNVNLVHMVHVDDAEVRLLASSGTNVTHCPASALKGGYGSTAVGKFPEMAAAGVNMMLGTDGSDIADMMKPMNLMAGLFKDARRDTSLFPASRVLEMATVNAARALGMADSIGSLAVGMKADLVLHDLDRPEWRPLNNYVNQLVWSADGRGVHSVWVDGRRLVDDYVCTVMDEEKVLADAQSAADAVMRRSGLPYVYDWPVL